MLNGIFKRGLVTTSGLAIGLALTLPTRADPPAASQPGLLATLSRALSQRAETLAADEEFSDSLEPQQAALDSDAIIPREGGRFDIHVREADLSAVLEMLSYQTRMNIIATDAVKGAVSANLYSVTFEEAIRNLLTPHQYVWRREGNTIFVGTQEEMAAHLPPPETRVFRLRFINRDEAVVAIKAVLSTSGTVVAGGKPSSGDASGGASGQSKGDEEASVQYVLVTDSRERLERVVKLVQEIDVRPRQVLIEATILRATLNEGNQFGIDFTMLGGVDFQNVASTSNASADLATGQLPADDLQSTTFNVNTNLIGNNLNGGFTFGLIKDSIAGFIRALEEVTDTTVVANPKLIALNRQEAEVIVGRRDGYVTTTVTETAAVQKIEFLETGTQIRFRPFINEDGTVRLAVHPKDSNGGLTAANLPFEETTEAHANILVNDGHTVLIGGLFRERTVSSRSQVPLIGDVPIAGLLFQHRNEETVREEVVILLTVHVLKETSEEAARFEALLDDVERVRVGSRRGLLGTGREQLAQAYYQEALRQFDCGDMDKALLNVRMALHNQPRHLAAMKLHEEICGQRLWDSDGTRSRVFLLDMLREENGHTGGVQGQEVFGRPPLDLEMNREQTPRKREDDEPQPGSETHP